jgi:hypothetical protein
VQVRLSDPAFGCEDLAIVELCSAPTWGLPHTSVSCRIRAVKYHADVLLVTVTKAETKAALQAAREPTGREAVPHDIDAKIYFDLGDIGGARVWLVRSEMRAGGPGGSQQAIAKALWFTSARQESRAA